MARLLPLVPCLALSVLAAGCASDTTQDPLPAPQPPAASAWALPENFTESAAVTASLFGCLAPTGTCDSYAFEIPEPEGANATMVTDPTGNATDDGAGNGTGAGPRKAEVTATLAWGVPANDLDLYLLDASGETVASDLALPPGSTASVSASLAPGKYTLEVIGYSAAADQYTLDVTFVERVAPEPADA